MRGLATALSGNAPVGGNIVERGDDSAANVDARNGVHHGPRNHLIAQHGQLAEDAIAVDAVVVLRQVPRQQDKAALVPSAVSTLVVFGHQRVGRIQRRRDNRHQDRQRLRSTTLVRNHIGNDDRLAQRRGRARNRPRVRIKRQTRGQPGQAVGVGRGSTLDRR